MDAMTQAARLGLRPATPSTCDRGARARSVRRLVATALVLTAATAFGCSTGGEPKEAKTGGDAAASSKPQEPGPDPKVQAKLHADKAAPVARSGLVVGASRAALVGRASDPTLPVPEDVKARFLAMRSDPDPEALTRNAHYWISNELAHELYRDHVTDLGGVLCGVGSDQMYLLAGWVNPAILVPLDFDQEIVNLHRVYGILFARAATPAELLAAFGKSKTDEVLAWIGESNYDDATQKTLAKTYKSARDKVRWRLETMSERYTNLKIPSFYQDQAQYDRVRNLWAQGRVFPIRGDLTADAAMQDLAKATRESGLVLSVLYLSNAEAYFPYAASYRRNIIVQPFDEKSKVLRTRQADYLGVADGDVYHFNVQSGFNFVDWMKTSRIEDLQELLRDRTESGTKGLTFLDAAPRVAKKPPEIAPIDP